jgi:putative transposase
MPRRPRIAPGGLVFHALNRAVARLPLFQKDGDYAAFLEVMHEAMKLHPIRLLSFCLMPNHWHMVLWPRADGELTAFLRWLTHTHTMRWHAHYHSSGTGHLYQGRFKAFPVETDDYFYTVLRYVERNALRANLVDRAEQWRWGSLWVRSSGDARTKSLLHSWPMPTLRNWAQLVNAAQTEAEVKALRRAVNRGTPFGSEAWQERMARRLGLQYTLRPRGRPKNTGASGQK